MNKTSTMSVSPITCHADGSVWCIELTRTEKMNAFTLDMYEQLASALEKLEEDPALHCGLIYTRGDHFTAGLDLGEVGPAIGAGKPLIEADRIDPMGLFGRRRSKPMVIAIHGYCLTVGIELALAMDVVVAHPDTQFGQIEVQRGIFPFGGATIRMPRTMGWGNAMRYLLTGDYFSGREAHRMGLVQELAENPEETGLAIARRIAAQAPLAVQEVLRNAHQSVTESEAAAIQSLMPALLKIMRTEDAAEGLQSFLERRAARFQGR